LLELPLVFSKVSHRCCIVDRGCTALPQMPQNRAISVTGMLFGPMLFNLWMRYYVAGWDAPNTERAALAGPITVRQHAAVFGTLHA
jgi:hypothetical protein